MKKTSLIAVAYEIPFPREFTRQEEPWRASHLWGGSELPTANFGGSSMIQMRIPASALR